MRNLIEDGSYHAGIFWNMKGNDAGGMEDSWRNARWLEPWSGRMEDGWDLGLKNAGFLVPQSTEKWWMATKQKYGGQLGLWPSVIWWNGGQQG